MDPSTEARVSEVQLMYKPFGQLCLATTLSLCVGKEVYVVAACSIVMLLYFQSAISLQAKALDQAMKEINNRFGKNSVMKLGANTFGEV